MWRGMFKAAGATTAFGVVHSLLASESAKAGAARLFGERNRDGFYRVFYNGQAAVTTGLLVAYVARQPGRELYRVRGPARWLMHAGQAAAVGMMASAVREVSLARMAGLSNVAGRISGGPVSPGMEAQGPAPGDDGRLRTGGAFRLSRHPLNFWAVPVIWLLPRMTTNVLAFNLAATAYLYLGSKREERRLLDAHGDEYRRYQSDVSFFLPSPGSDGRQPRIERSADLTSGRPASRRLFGRRASHT